uniref:Uncharacterized protein n=1 Tax=Arundo donax TaxID=35708 RepID=A0A0A8YVV0_ARUDO
MYEISLILFFQGIRSHKQSLHNYPQFCNLSSGAAQRP